MGENQFAGLSYSKGVSLIIPNYSVYDLLTKTVREKADLPAIAFYGHTLTYKELGYAVRVLACGLQDKGFKKGDRIALMLPNCPQYIIAFYAAMAIGAIVVQVNPMYTERELDHVLQDSDANGFIVLAELYPRFLRSAFSGKIKHVVVVSFGSEPAGIPYASHTVFYDDLLKQAKTDHVNNFVGVEIDSEQDIAVLQYTGGTTGRSKGAMLTHRNLVANAYQISEHGLKGIAKPDEQPRYLLVAPFFHVYGMSSGMNSAVLNGALMVVLRRYEPKEVLETIRTFQPHYFPGVPTMYMALNSYPDAAHYNIDSIQVCISGSAPLPIELMTSFQSKTGAKILEGYGLSEASPVTHITPMDGSSKLGSIGITAPGTESRIVDLATGTQTCVCGEVGELVVRGPQVMKGYWRMQEETEHTLRDGWLYTGDIAKMDDDSYYYIVDRKKDLIIAGGFNIYPREVEEILYKYPKVQEAIVVGVPDAYRGETVHAHIVVKPGEQATEQEIIEFCRSHMAAYKVPRHVVFREQLPKSAVGKLLRRAVLEEIKKGEDSAGLSNVTKPS